MSTPEASPRPSQVTAAGWTVAIASVLLLIFVFDSLGALHSIATREDLAERIASGNLKGLGITVAEALDIRRWALYVSGVAAVATGILGIFVLQRDKAARIGLTVAAVPIVLAAMVTESVLGVLVGAGTAVLWGRTARDWFAGRPIAPREPRQVERPAERPPGGTAPWLPPGQTPSPEAQPPPTLGWGSPGGAVALQDLPPPVVVAAPGSTPPSQVRVACILTWVLTAVTALGFLVTLAAIAIDQQFLIDRVKDSPAWDPTSSDDLIVTVTVSVSVVFLVWCAATAVVAVFTWRGAHWAWVLHAISTVVAGVIAVLVFPYSLLHLAAIGAALGMLLSRPVRDWFAGRRP